LRPTRFQPARLLSGFFTSRELASMLIEAAELTISFFADAAAEMMMPQPPLRAA
jgi:hypothetical protein